MKPPSSTHRWLRRLPGAVLFTLCLGLAVGQLAAAAPGPAGDGPATAVSASADSSPQVDPRSWVLVHIDVETTGLTAGFHELVDIGVLYTDLDGNRLGEFFRRVMPEHPERLSPRAAEINGFDVERWRTLGASPLGEVLDAMIAYEDQHFPGRPRLRVAYNSWFDAGFLQEAFLGVGRDWRERYSRWFLDLPSIAWGLGFRETRNWILAPQLGLPPETDNPLEHTGLSGVEWNVALYRALLGKERSAAFFARLATLCGKAFAGRVVENDPPPAPGTNDPFSAQRLVMHVRQCDENEIRIPLQVGEDRSRTWVVRRTATGGLRLKHDHRHADGTPDKVTFYGGDGIDPGTASRQEFPADAESRAVFAAAGLTASLANVWALELEPGERLVYELTRPGRRFRLEFDLRSPVEPPPAPWGAGVR